MGCEYDGLKATKLSDILCWHQITPNEIGGKDANYNKWQEICVLYPLAYLKWTDVEKAQIVDLKKRDIHISDTALGHHQVTNMRELEASVNLYTEEQLIALETRVVETRDMNVDNILPV